MADLAFDNESDPERRLEARRGIFAFLSDSLAAERDRWALWLPVGLAVGIMLYFGLRHEPPLLLGTGLAVPLLAAAFLARRNSSGKAPVVLALTLPLGVIAAGFALAQWESWRVAAPVLGHPLGIVAVSGRVVDVEALDGGTRVTLAPDAIGGLAPADLPRFIRIKLKSATAGLEAGDHLAAKASLMPPPGPALPGGFDFQRQAWFRGLGGVGYAVGQVEVVAGTPSGPAMWLRALRLTMTARIRAALPGPEGGIAAAMITGERGAVPADTNQDYRDSGLAHLLVIAGLHMTLVTGFVFFAMRGVLALIPSIALRYPIKKWAALAALLVATAYLVISGAAIPTQRAYVMVALGLAAILIDRLHVSMAGVGWAAGLVLLLDPSAVIGVSFQMSFAAVVGLISFYEAFGPRLSMLRGGSGPVGRGLLHLAGIGITTIVATVGTAAFSVYHFNRFAVFSVLANVIAVPLAGFWVMPWAFASCLLMPLGLERFGLAPMGWGLDAVAAVAHWTATLPYAVLDLPSMPGWGLAAIAAGGLWLALWRTSWRCWGAIVMGLGVASLLTVTPPDIIVSGDARLAALHGAGGYLLSSPKADKVDAEEWLRAAGGVRRNLLPEPGGELEGVRCDPLGCLWHAGARTVALVRDQAALDEDCRHADVVIAFMSVRRGCRAMTTVVDRADLRRDGATAIWLGGTVRIATANGERGDRPWVPKPMAYVPFNNAAATPPDDPAP